MPLPIMPAHNKLGLPSVALDCLEKSARRTSGTGNDEEYIVDPDAIDERDMRLLLHYNLIDAAGRLTSLGLRALRTRLLGDA